LNHGFTLIEMLVVLIISSVLAAIALPTFMSQANKAKQVEARTSIATLNRAQQAYYLEHQAFTDQMSELGVGVNMRNEQYEYKILLPNVPSADSRSPESPSVVQRATSRSPNLRSYVGMAGLISPAGEPVIDTVLCETEQAGTTAPPAPQPEPAAIQCGSGTRPLN
jgi:prepilin-type N-terminal cleavage/methylation domain-containing protein